MNTENSQPPLSGSAVYLVEDDRAVRESLELLLRLRGFIPKGFASGEEFLEYSALQRPACALLDVRLPGIDGLELQRQLRAKHPGLPTIVITAHGDVSTARTALRDGAVDFLEKPIDEGDLLEAVNAALTSGSLRANARSSSASPTASTTARSPRSSASARVPSKCIARASWKSCARAESPTSSGCASISSAISPARSPRSREQCPQRSRFATCACVRELSANVRTISTEFRAAASLATLRSNLMSGGTAS